MDQQPCGPGSPGLRESFPFWTMEDLRPGEAPISWQDHSSIVPLLQCFENCDCRTVSPTLLPVIYFPRLFSAPLLGGSLSSGCSSNIPPDICGRNRLKGGMHRLWSAQCPWCLTLTGLNADHRTEARILHSLLFSHHLTSL